MQAKASALVAQRAVLLAGLARQPGLGAAIGASDANFVMVPVLGAEEGAGPDNARAQRVYRALAEAEGVVVRFRGLEPGCAGCLRITVGTEAENELVLAKLKDVLERM
jgi:histidinol-phosphate aminotransferase